MSQPAARQLQAFAPWNDPDAIPLIRIENVSKNFGDFKALNGVNLDIYPGEFFSLLGASGCGKTTLLRMLAGFETPSEGRIIIDGVDMSKIPPYERPVNMMFQSYALFPHMSVEQNIAFGLKQDGYSAHYIREKVSALLDLVQMEKFAKRKPHQLSGGQRQRVALARSLAKEPKVLLLDEPLAALDKKLRERTQLELVNIQERIGVTFVMVTHDQEEAMTMSARIGVMSAGYLEQVGTPVEIYEYPSTSFVANFIGAANLFEGVVEVEGPPNVVISCPALERDLTISHGGKVPLGAPAMVMVRPEKMTVSLTPPTNDELNWVKGVVQDIAYLGDVSIYHVMLDAGIKVQVSQINLRHTSAQRVTWEDEVYVAWHPGNALVLMQ